jgi:hypothetical protein
MKCCNVIRITGDSKTIWFESSFQNWSILLVLLLRVYVLIFRISITYKSGQEVLLFAAKARTRLTATSSVSLTSAYAYQQ